MQKTQQNKINKTVDAVLHRIAVKVLVAAAIAAALLTIGWLIQSGALLEIFPALRVPDVPRS